jgi:diphthamide synthase (EF-2-diphthine--ammonia ligase)
VVREHEPRVRKVVLSWSSGKDSAWMLHLLRQQSNIHVAALLTTFNSEADRVAMHAVRRTLVEAQAERTGIPLWAVELPWPCSNLEYEERMRAACQGQWLRVLPRLHSETCFFRIFETTECGN